MVLVVEVAERRLPAAAGFFRGVIGCYYFHDMQAVMAECLENSVTRFSGYFNRLAARRAPAQGVILEEAEFFGDGERIRLLEEGKPARGTIFCDIDGTLIQHEDRPDYSRLPRLLPGSREKLRQWIAEGYHVVLCTARRTEDEPRLVEMMRELALPYHRIVSGLPSGMRVVINDRKPHAMFTSQAASLEIARDQGIAAVEILPGRKLEVLRRFPGGSLRRNPADGGERAPLRAQARQQGGASRGLAITGCATSSAPWSVSRSWPRGWCPRLRARRTIPTNISTTWNICGITASLPTGRRPRRPRRWTGCSTNSAVISIASAAAIITGAAEDWFRRSPGRPSDPRPRSRRCARHERLRPFLTGDGVEIDGACGILQPRSAIAGTVPHHRGG